MSHERAEATLFGDALACEDTLRATFLPQAIDPLAVEALCARAESHLSAIAVIEDSRAEEEDGLQGLALRRIEAKLDLLLTLVGALNGQIAGDPGVALRWSARGACLPVPEMLDVGRTGLFRVQAASWLPEPLTLPAQVLACEPGAGGAAVAWLAFQPLSEGARSALERHVFRLHRRAIAERRAQRDAT